MTMTPTNDRPPATTGRPSAHTSNPVRIGRIGADHIQVSIRPALDDAELIVLVDRLEQLIDAGYETIDVVFDASDATDEPAELGDLLTIASRELAEPSPVREGSSP